LLPIVNRSLGLSDVRPNPAVVVRELSLVFDEPTIEFDDIRILDNIKSRWHEGRGR
jgi:hypothetical protein